MSKQTCYEAFKQGKMDRTNRPLPYGHYKLREAYENLAEWGKELNRIAVYVSGKTGRNNLMHCTPEDMHVWLKDLPALVAHTVAYELLPGLLALDKDGADSTLIASCYPNIERECIDLLDRLELARLKLQRGIGTEYNLMKHGGSTLMPLMDEAIAIARGALKLSPYRW